MTSASPPETLREAIHAAMEARGWRIEGADTGSVYWSPQNRPFASFDEVVLCDDMHGVVAEIFAEAKGQAR